MERARRYLINAADFKRRTLLMRTVSVAFNAFCVNRVGEEGMGLFSLVMSVYTFAVTLATSGVNLAATRLTALYFGKGEGRSVRSAMRRCLLYSAFFGALASLLLFLFADFVSVNFLMEPRAKMSVRALSISLLPLSLCSAFSGYFAAVRRVYKNAISQILEQMIKIFACAFLLSLFVPRGVEYACLALVLGGAISETASFIMQLFAYIRDKRKLTGNGERVPMRAVLDISLPVALSAYVRSGLVTLEHILIPIGLTAFGDPRALATYGVISAVALPTVMYPSAFVGAFSSLVIPEVTEFHSAENKREVSYVTSRAFYVTLFFFHSLRGDFLYFSGRYLHGDLWGRGGGGLSARACPADAGYVFGYGDRFNLERTWKTVLYHVRQYSRCRAQCAASVVAGAAYRNLGIYFGHLYFGMCEYGFQYLEIDRACGF